MAMKPIIENEAEIPETLKEHYKKNGEGKFVLEVEGGVVPTARLNEMRDSNTRILRERDELKTKLEEFEDIGDAERLRDLKGKEQELSDAKLVKKDGVEKLIEERTKTMREDSEKKLAKEAAKAQALQSRLESMMIDQEAMKEAARLGAKPAAMDDIVARIKSRAKMEGDKVVLYKQDGQKDYNTKSELKTIAEAVEELSTSAVHLFEGNEGAQSQTTGDGTRRVIADGPNPWKKGEHFNLTRQMEIVKKDPVKAKRFKQEAGINV